MEAIKKNFMSLSSPILIIGACFLWSLDIIVRYPTSLNVDNKVLIFLENLIGLIFITPVLIKRHGHRLYNLKPRQWVHVSFLGVFGSALAGMFCVSSIKGIGPDNFSFFQIFQPLIVIFLAKRFLNERVDSLYGMMTLWILVSSFMMISQDFSFDVFWEKTSGNQVAVLSALLAMIFWGMSTVVGKSILQTLPPMIVLFWRWAIALTATALIMGNELFAIPWEMFLDTGVILRMLFISLFSGVFAMMIYYQGLRNLPAGMVAFLELSYPAFGILLGQLYFNKTLSPNQLLGFFSLMFALVLLNKLPNQNREEDRIIS